MSHSKWHRIKAEAAKETDAEKELKNQTDAVDKPAELAALLNTRIGATDLPEEIDAQKHNLGPKDTSLEVEELEPNSPKFS
ncbi:MULTISPECIES: hypothetical protein [Legionella]|uniref:hypothetical protein n=1 Tax=Legionella TaxID=445 RepID=UPI0009683657|nr:MULTISPECIES: hypothetical protein [Legionella]MBN9228805.1 hypothetical protein [Legionella steelei]OJW16212.1 MAG: hypothetical protein BGO44_06940 [Legionella sp. 39-23]